MNRKASTTYGRDLLTLAAILMGDMEALTDEMYAHTRPIEAIRADSRRVQEQWRNVMRELEKCHSTVPVA